MISKGSVQTFDMTITVAGGTGSGTFRERGHIRNICFTPPANAKFDYEITDEAGNGIDGEQGLNGQTTLPKDVPFVGLCTLTLKAAVPNGTWIVRVYADLSA